MQYWAGGTGNCWVPSSSNRSWLSLPPPPNLLPILYYFKNKVTKPRWTPFINAPKFTFFPSLSFCTCSEFSLAFPDLTFCFTCFFCLGTYLPIKFPSTLCEWMPFSVVCIQKFPDGRRGKQPWQFLDVILIDFEWWSLTEETPYGTTPSQSLEL